MVIAKDPVKLYCRLTIWIYIIIKLLTTSITGWALFGVVDKFRYITLWLSPQFIILSRVVVAKVYGPLSFAVSSVPSHIQDKTIKGSLTRDPQTFRINGPYVPKCADNLINIYYETTENRLELGGFLNSFQQFILEWWSSDLIQREFA